MPGYNDLANDVPGNTAKLEAAVSEALADLWSMPTQAEKAKYAHDYLTYHNVYDFNARHGQTMYSALVEGGSVCAGYTHAFQYLMQQMGIPCAYVLGYANGYHAWNIVKLDNEYYAMDVTWDDPLGAPPEKFSYKYFNLTDQALSADHVRVEISASIPEAAGTACSYQNAFGGNAYGTDFEAIVGVMPEKVQPEQPATENPYLG
jgi:transglutaminase-like putative cysteine protease